MSKSINKAKLFTKSERLPQNLLTFFFMTIVIKVKLKKSEKETKYKVASISDYHVRAKLSFIKSLKS